MELEGGVGFKKEGESTKEKVKSDQLQLKSGWNWQGKEGKAKNNRAMNS